MKLTLKTIMPAIALSALAAAGMAAAQGAYRSPWSGCCGMRPWPQAPGGHGPGMMGPGMMGPSGMGPGMMGGSAARNHAAMMGGVPAAYASLRNPLPRTNATVAHGAEVYAANCASCHGESGYGDGPAARALNPPPADLAWLSRMRMSRWDPFMYWTVAEGGVPFGTAMPAFKDALPKGDIWAVIAYIQARLPQTRPSK